VAQYSVVRLPHREPERCVADWEGHRGGSWWAARCMVCRWLRWFVMRQLWRREWWGRCWEVGGAPVGNRLLVVVAPHWWWWGCVQRWSWLAEGACGRIVVDWGLLLVMMACPVCSGRLMLLAVGLGRDSWGWVEPRWCCCVGSRRHVSGWRLGVVIVRGLLLWHSRRPKTSVAVEPLKARKWINCQLLCCKQSQSFMGNTIRWILILLDGQIPKLWNEMAAPPRVIDNSELQLNGESSRTQTEAEWGADNYEKPLMEPPAHPYRFWAKWVELPAEGTAAVSQQGETLIEKRHKK
jgi:hypothetical protein